MTPRRPVEPTNVAVVTVLPSVFPATAGEATELTKLMQVGMATTSVEAATGT